MFISCRQSVDNAKKVLKQMLKKHADINTCQSIENGISQVLKSTHDIIATPYVSKQGFLHFLSCLQSKIINFARNQQCVYKVVSN